MSDGCVRLFTTNYVDIDLLANSDVSSEQTAFPITNAYSKQRRSKVWRSNGHFKIVSGDNTIVFNEGGGDFTATIAAGDYASTALFMAAIKTAFEDVGAGTYTITQNSSLKFVITKSAGTLNIKWTHANSADMAAILGYDTATDDTGSLAYTADALRIMTDEQILWDMGISSNPDAFAMTGPRNRPIKLSPSAVIKLEGNETNDFSMPTYSTTLSYDDEVIAILQIGGLAPSSLRYWRLSIVDQNALGYVEVGAFFLGKIYSPQRGRAGFPMTVSFVDRTQNIFSEGGQSYSDIFEKTQIHTLNWNGLTKEDIEELDDIFETYGTGIPFFISIDSDAAFSTSLNRRLVFVKFDKEPQYELISMNNYSVSTSFREEL
jgi:hypothetical protein